MTAITKWVLKRKAVTLLITVLILAGGIFAVTRLKSELLPNINFPYLAVSTAYPGASSESVAEKVSAPIENSLTQIAGLKTLRSTSLGSFSLVVAEFEFGTNIKDVEQTLAGKLRNLSLPSGFNGNPLQPNIETFNLNSQPVLELTVEGLKGQSGEALSKWGSEVAKPSFSKLADVSNVELAGTVKQLVTVSFKSSELAKRNLTLDDAYNTLKSVGLNFPAGTATASNLTLSTSVVYTLKQPSDIGQLLILPSQSTGAGAVAGSTGAATDPTSQGVPAGATQVQPVRLSEVAEVKLAPDQSGGISRTNGKPGLGLQVFKTQSGNTVTVSDGVLKKIDELNRQYPDYKVAVVYDQALTVRKSIDGLVKEGLLGAVFAIAVIFLFLRSVRSTLVTAVSIPTSVVAALILMWTQNISLNIFSLGGLAIAIGRVVDDAIVVLENIFRHVQDGEDVPTAVQNGTKEVAGAITSSTITTVAVFLPLGFVGGLTGQIFLPFALTVTFALLASLVVALTIIPVCAALLINRKLAAREQKREAKLSLSQKLYLPTLKWSLKHRWLTLVIAFGLLVGSLGGVAAAGLPIAFLPESGDKLVTVAVNPGPGSNQASVLALTEQVEKTLSQYKAKNTVTLYQTTLAGNSNFALSQQADSGNTGSTITVRLNPATKTAAFVKELDESLRKLTPKGGSISVESNDGFGGGGLNLTVQGPNPEAVRQASSQIVAALQPFSTLSNVRSDVSQLSPQVVITPDPTKNVLADPLLIGSQVRNLLVGQNLGTVQFTNGQSLEVLLSLPRPDGGSLEQYIENLKQVPVAEGVKLGDLAKVEKVDANNQTVRINQSLAATIQANIIVDDTAGVGAAALEKVNSLKLPAGIKVTQGGSGQQQDEAFGGLSVAILIAIALVYLVMVLAFGSLVEPFVILFSLPLAIIGALGALVITGRALGLPALIGFLMLIGIVVTNAIVLIDLVNQLRKRGHGRDEALIEAGATRLRPILMTAVATILALTPLALGLNEGSIIAAELGTVVIGGLFSSTLLTLVVVPVVYSLIEGAKERLSRHPDQPPTTSGPTEESNQPEPATVGAGPA